MVENPNSGAAAPDWLVVWTESRAERKVVARIAAQGIDTWLPTALERHRWSDRWRDVVVPLFPCYVFARTGHAGVGRLLRTPGVLTVVKSGGKPACLTDGFINSLREAIASGVGAEPVSTHDYRIDDEIIVCEGPLSGMRGVVRQVRGSTRLVVWVSEIGRGIAFTVGAPAVTRAVPVAVATA